MSFFNVTTQFLVSDSCPPEVHTHRKIDYEKKQIGFATCNRAAVVNSKFVPLMSPNGIRGTADPNSVFGETSSYRNSAISTTTLSWLSYAIILLFTSLLV